VPLVGEDRLAVLDRDTWEFSRSIPVRGHPVYAVRSPTEREVWVSFSGEEDDAYVQVIDVESLDVTDTIEVGRRIYHMDFTPRASHVLISANADEKLFLVDATTHRIEDVVELNSPSGIFGVWRAFRIGL
jgi:protein NirF